MDSILTIFNGIAGIVAAIGIAMSAIFVVWSGYLFISSPGDPQGIARARMSLIGVVIGICIIGGAFIFPATISRFVVEPAGGLKIDPQAAVDCDGILRQHLVHQRNANNKDRMQYLINQVQAQNDGCAPESWSPQVKRLGIPNGCRDVDEHGTLVVPTSIGTVLVPDTSIAPGGVPLPHSTRDGDNNILVYFAELGDRVDNLTGLPANGAVCWVYVAAFSAWAEGYYIPPPSP